MNDWKILAKEQMKQLKISQYDLAEKLDCSQGAVAHWLSGRRTADIDTINKILDALGLPSLSVGGKSKLSSNQHANIKDIESYIQLAKPFSYPIILWGDAEKFIDKRLSSNQFRGALMSSINIKNGFWVEVSGDSMWSSSPVNKITFPNGTLILVQPDFKKLEPEKFYIVRLPDGTQTFKQLIRDAGISYLKSLNDNYKPIPINENDCHFLGLVVDRDLGKLY